MKMLGLFLLFVGAVALAHPESHCGESSWDPTCIEKVTDHCYRSTSHNRDTCFSKAERICAAGTAASCVETVESYCYSKTSWNHDQCFEKAAQACSAGAIAECITSTEEYCYRNTSGNHDQCFTRAINTCSGTYGPNAFLELMEEVKKAQILKSQGVSILKQKSAAPKKK